MVEKIISGGQSGADIGGWIAAKECGVKTSGWMPKGFRTEDGPKPEYEKRYDARETRSESYYPRTDQNIKESDGTLIVANLFNSPGTKITKQYCERHGKPYFLLPYLSKIEPTNQLIKWIKDRKIRVLNVAGNRESVCPGICNYTVLILVKVLNQLKNENQEKINDNQKAG